MTCFWDGIMKQLNDNDFKLLSSQKEKNKHFILLLKKNNKIKDINFTSDGKDYHFQERVKALSLKDFEHLFEKAGVYLLDIFGDYKLNKFKNKTSERLIMIFK